ncbi:MAG: BamA/TamA family outer membrane protein [Flavobacteriia bacterium]|nr:BamA/TamA family outer membrane protein [Flavobacteriia bacterium]
MNKGQIYSIFIISSLLIYSCNPTKYIPDGKKIVNKNVVHYYEDKLNSDEVNLIIRQQPNKSILGMKIKLFIFNHIDSTKTAHASQRHWKKIRKINTRKLNRQNKINNKRVEKAKKRGRKYYTQRLVPLKDTLNIKLTFREWLKFKRGEPAVVFDSTINKKTVDQIKIYLRKKGYYYGEVYSEFQDGGKNNKKRTVNYHIKSGKAYYIDSFYFECSNSTVLALYQKYFKKQLFNPLLGEKFDSDYLNDHRSKVAKFIKDNSIYGFSPQSISFLADTNKRDMKLILKIIVDDRKIQKNDTVITVPYQTAYVRNINFRLSDTSYYKGNFKNDLNKKGLSVTENAFLRTLDTMQYREIYLTKGDKKRRKIKTDKDTLNPWRFATVYYNVKPIVRPSILELQNYLESNNVYKEYYIDRSYNRLMQLDVFQTIKPVIKEVEGTNLIDVDYYLVPAKKQTFNLEPRFTNANGFLGLSASINYNNKNIFRRSDKLTISFSGGFESQPPVFDQTESGEKINDAGRSFNTFEIGPSIKLDVPGLFPSKPQKLSKRHRPRTIMSAAYNYQKRNDFSREVFQFNYLWKFYSGKKQLFQVGFPAASIKFVNIKMKDFFKEKLYENNDLFLINAYSNQFVWEDFKFLFEYNNKAEKKGKANHLLNFSIINSGWLLSLLNLRDTSNTGQKEFFNVAYSRFIKAEADYIYGYPLGKKTSVHARVNLGFGVPTGNSTTSLPFDYSFFSGGANDNRGWRARELGPGAYKYYLDPDRTATQIGDVKIAAYSELRYSLSSTFKTAIFIDLSNIWTYKNDINRPGSQFNNQFYEQLALSSGIGLRFDATFLIVRLDLGFPITNPALPDGERWVFQEKDNYYKEGEAVFGVDYKSYLPKPFRPKLQFGIGYPF